MGVSIRERSGALQRAPQLQRRNRRRAAAIVLRRPGKYPAVQLHRRAVAPENLRRPARGQGGPAMIRQSFSILFLTATLLGAGGCMTMVTPPTHPQHPVQVFLTDQLIHSSVLLPTDDGRYIEYAFGDWNYAALNHCWPHDAIGAMFFSGQ